ncbi:thioredoxin family protein [Levilactobacillus acidifarinae]|uniref:Thioredoxin n=1 Tax=Levilactobacillus acidifarinae DSM 19394 = JCM 15949 TaxID=1423715 RepID=A0A0R1LEL4_9LACO|nr:thioredoxin family protein [Levilactobacillus acidifarinae]KRK94109.1 thioredoxin [Levilactobacillus acidifarinae DSM 19394]GEO69723.1 thioredoxin [Levilactobacillus acidifarinae]
MIKEIHDATFATETAHGVTVVDFRADWCPPCKMMDPILKDLSQDQNYGQRATFVSLNVDHDQQMANQFQVQGIPTFLLMRDGQVIDRLVGARPKPLFAAALDRVLAAQSLPTEN